MSSAAILSSTQTFTGQNTFNNKVIISSSFAVSSGVVIDNGISNSAAILKVISQNKGFFPPRMTLTERANILSPATGLIIYNNSSNNLQLYNGTCQTTLIISTSDLNNGQVIFGNSTKGVSSNIKFILG